MPEDMYYPCIRELSEMIVTIKPGLVPEDIEATSSLTVDLRLASLEMIHLSARVKERWPGLDLTRWWAQAISTEDDSLGSLASFVHTSHDHT